MNMNLRVFGICALFCYSLISCKEEVVPEVYMPSNKHKAYIVSLQNLNLDKTALGKDWIESSSLALSHPVLIETPYEEAFYLDPNDAEAVGYRFEVKRGQKVVVDVFSAASDSLILFVDLFRVINDSLQRWAHVATASDLDNRLAFEPRQDSDYILRIQPELLRGGKFSLTIRRSPTLLFPVAGKDSRAIGSVFGDPRDGGRREHHGVDIFAKRHTPIIAPIRGYVRRVGQQKLGGNIIWISDRERGQSLYFAHLQEQLVEANTWVEPGDTIGTVGNTGNARSTPTHLHFGIYSRGPKDPFYFIKELDQETDSVIVDKEIIGSLVRISRTHPFSPLVSPVANRNLGSDTLWQNQIMEVIGAFKNYYKVRVEDHQIAYIPQGLIESAALPLEDEITLEKEYPLLIEPNKTSISKQIVSSGEQVELLGQSSTYWWIRTNSGAIGWIDAAEIIQ